MQKPNDYDELKVGGDFTPVELGGHHLVIKGVREQETSTGKPMIVVAFDFAKNDSQPNYFSEMFEKDIRPEKKWPNGGTQYIMTQDWQDASKTSANFKRFITAVEKSNGFEVSWGAKFCEQFKNKKVGGVFGLVEEEYNGEIKKRHKLRWFCEDANVEKQAIPKEKLIEGGATASVSSVASVNGAEADEIPF